MLFKKYILLEVSYFVRKIYETETVTLELCYIEDLISHTHTHFFAKKFKKKNTYENQVYE